MLGRINIDEVSHKKDIELLLGRYWSFLTLTQTLKNIGDYVLIEIGTTEVVAYHSESGYVAFRNRCPHRGNRLFTKKNGNGRLRCNLHGWSFSANGQIKAIPFYAESYQYSQSEINRLRLTRYPLRQIGAFLFICLTEDLPPLENQFKPKTIKALESISEHLDARISSTELTGAFNWKFGLEIIMDPLHAPFLHAQTLAKNRYAPTATNSPANIRPFSPPSPDAFHLAAEACDLSTYSSQEIKNFKQSPWFKDVSRYGALDHYYDWIFFPNLHIASASGGHSFLITHFSPISCGQTKIYQYFTTAKEISHNPYLASVRLESLREGIKTFEEDNTACENLHRNAVAYPNEENIHGKYELAILRWRRWLSENVYLH